MTKNTLDSSLIQYINNAVKAANIINIDGLIIDNDYIRGMDEKRTTVILETQNIKQLPFKSIAINRLSLYQSRISLINQQQKYNVRYDINNNDNIERLMFSTKSTNIDFRCADPSVILAPKKINDNIQFNFQINLDLLNLIQQAQTAMGGENINISFDGNKSIEIKISDINHDIFKHNIDTIVYNENGKPTNKKFSHNYLIKTLLLILKQQNQDNIISIGQNGSLWSKVNQLTTILLPRVQTQ